MKLIEKFNFACVSDIHLGNPRNQATKTIENLDKVIVASGLLTKVKLLLLAGDVFDQLLDLANPDILAIDRWMVRLIKACRANNVILRVLEGTPSHDRKQGIRFDFLNEVSGSPLAGDFRYVTDVSVEYMPSLGIHVLYVPDEAYPTTQETREVVSSVLRSNNIERVDIACMHGFFQYQIPYQTKEDAYHDIDFYESITNYWIPIGHVHTHSRNGKVVAQGSFDRNSHGEEEPKGMIMASVGDPKGDKVWFLENKGAHVYRTIKVHDMAIEDIFSLLEKELKNCVAYDRIRIEAESTHPIFSHMVEVQKRWPELNFTKHPKAIDEVDPLQKLAQEPEVLKWMHVSITSDNIEQLVAKKLDSMGVDAQMSSACLRHLAASI